MGRRVYSPKRCVFSLYYMYIILNLLQEHIGHENHASWWFSCSLLSVHLKTDRPQRATPPSLGVTPRLDFRVAEGFPQPHHPSLTRNVRRRAFPDCTTPPSLKTRDGGSSEHEKTPALCLFMLGAFPSSTDPRRTQRDTNTVVGVSSCSLCFLHPPEHEEALTMVSPRAWRSLPHAEHKKTPTLCLFVLGTFPTPKHENTPPLVCLCVSSLDPSPIDSLQHYYIPSYLVIIKYLK